LLVVGVAAVLVYCVVGEVEVVVVGLGSSTTRVVTTTGVGELVEEEGEEEEVGSLVGVDEEDEVGEESLEEEVAGSGMVVTAVETAASVLLDAPGEGLLIP
jgi:hypothetical protein